MNTADYNGRKLVLCEDQTPGFSTRIAAEVKDGCFIITGRDEGAAVQAFIGVPGYEYYYMCDRENTGKLFALLAAGGADPMETIGRVYSGMDCAARFRRFCEENQITCRFDTKH